MDSGEMTRSRANECERRGEWEDALQLRGSPGGQMSVEDRYRLALLQTRMGRYADAEQTIEEMEDAFPMDSMALRCAATWRARYSDRRAALSLIDRSIALGIDLPDRLMLKVSVIDHQERALAREILVRVGEFMGSWMVLATVLLDFLDGRRSKAESDTIQSFQTGVLDDSAIMWIVKVASRFGHEESARRIMKATECYASGLYYEWVDLFLADQDSDGLVRFVKTKGEAELIVSSLDADMLGQIANVLGDQGEMPLCRIALRCRRFKLESARELAMLMWIEWSLGNRMEAFRLATYRMSFPNPGAYTYKCLIFGNLHDWKLTKAIRLIPGLFRASAREVRLAGRGSA